MALKDVKSRIASVKNIQKITRAMEMVAAARLRRAEQRIEHLRPYAGAIRRMTRQAAEAAQSLPKFPILQEHESENSVGILLVTGDRGLAGAFNSQIVRAGVRHAAALEGEGKSLVFYASGRRGVSSLTFRHREPKGAYTGFTDRPSYGNARDIASDLIADYVDGELDRVEIFYNRYISPLTQQVTQETLLPLQQASIFEEGSDDDGLGSRASEGHDDDSHQRHGPGALVGSEPHPGGAGGVEPRPGGDPQAAGTRLRRDLDLPGAARVHRLRARRAHDRHAQRVRERELSDPGPDTADEPRAPGGRHPGDHGSRRRGGGPRLRSEVEASAQILPEELQADE